MPDSQPAWSRRPGAQPARNALGPHQSGTRRLKSSAEDISAGEVKVCIGGEASSADLRRRGGLKGGETLLEARGAILRRRVEAQDGGEGSSMDDALPRVTTRLKTQ